MPLYIMLSQLVLHRHLQWIVRITPCVLPYNAFGKDYISQLAFKQLEIPQVKQQEATIDRKGWASLILFPLPLNSEMGLATWRMNGYLQSLCCGKQKQPLRCLEEKCGYKDYNLTQSCVDAWCIVNGKQEKNVSITHKYLVHNLTCTLSRTVLVNFNIWLQFKRCSPRYKPQLLCKVWN